MGILKREKDDLHTGGYTRVHVKEDRAVKGGKGAEAA